MLITALILSLFFGFYILVGIKMIFTTGIEITHLILLFIAVIIFAFSIGYIFGI